MPTHAVPTIVHMDLDAFFASVEQLANPFLRDKPLVVAGPGKRSIITTASYPARAYGIRTGMTVGQAKVLCRDMIVIRSDYRKYSDASRKVMEVLETFTPDVHAASVDEAFMDATLILDKYGSPENLGTEIREMVRRLTGLTCSVGMARNRLLAKLAGGMNKPDGLTVLKPGDEKEILDGMPVRKLCGIGPATARALGDLGINTCGQLGRYPVEVLIKRFGAKGRTLSDMGRGEGGGLWNRGQPADEPAKSIGHSVTLPSDLADKGSMGMVLQTLSEMVGRRARRHGCRGKTLTLTWRYEDFYSRSRRVSVPSALSNTSDIYRTAMGVLDTVEVEKPVRLLGISLSDLTFGEVTGALFPEENRKEEVQRTVDVINDRFGEFTLAFGDSIPDLGKVKVISPSWRAKGIRNSF